MIRCLTKKDCMAACDVTASRKSIKGNHFTHRHDFYEIEFVIEGSGTYIIDGVCHEIKIGMIFFMTPVNFHEIKHSDAEIINVMFSNDACNRNTLFDTTGSDINNIISLDDKDFDVVLTLLNELIFAADNNHIQYSSSILDCVLYKIRIPHKYNNSINHTHVQSAMLYIQNHFRSNISLNDVAAFVGLSAPYLSSLFAKETGMTLKNHINSLRFDYAKKLLTYTDMSVGQVCSESGFEDYANFLRHFKKYFGVTPGSLKKNSSPIQ